VIIGIALGIMGSGTSITIGFLESGSIKADVVSKGGGSRSTKVERVVDNGRWGSGDREIEEMGGRRQRR
jgi:hypothetical protein